MPETQKKIKRLASVIRVRKKAVEDASNVLALTRNKKLAAMENLRSVQNEYLTGIERLNLERSSLSRDKLAPLERGLDATKEKWMRIYQQVLDLEKKEQVDHSILSKALMDLKAVDSLSESYRTAFKSELLKVEQKISDESAIRRYLVSRGE